MVPGYPRVTETRVPGYRISTHPSPIVYHLQSVYLQKINEPEHAKTNKMTCASAQSDQSLCSVRFKGQVESKDSDQTGRMPRLIQVVTGCTDHFVPFAVAQIIDLWSSQIMRFLIVEFLHLFSPLRYVCENYMQKI